MVDFLITEAFQDFLKSFKSTTSTEAAARDALSHLNMDDEDIDVDDTPRRRSARKNARGSRKRQAATPEPKLKYMEQLQEVANRERTSITIELEDLSAVRSRFNNPCVFASDGIVVRKE
jgi:DNA replication licensing factor MCM7